MSAESMIAKYGKTVTLTREAVSGTIDTEGGFVAGTNTTTSIVMSIQPLSGDEVLRLPDGMRGKKVMKGYTITEIINGNEPDKIAPDLITDGDQVYEVNDVQFYEATTLNISPHYRATLVRVNPT